MPRNSIFPFVLLALAGGTLASAQTIGVRTLALRSGDMPEVYLQTAEAPALLEWSATQPAEAVRALRASPLPLYKKGVDPEGKEAFLVSERVQVPPGAKGILLLGWSLGKEARYVAIEDDFAGARFNHWLLINTCSKPVAFQVGEKTRPVVVAPGASTTHRIAADKGKGATVLAQAPFDGEAKTFFSTYWPVAADKRTVVLFVEDGARIRVKRISDQLAAPER